MNANPLALAFRGTMPNAATNLQPDGSWHAEMSSTVDGVTCAAVGDGPTPRHAINAMIRRWNERIGELAAEDYLASSPAPRPPDLAGGGDETDGTTGTAAVAASQAVRTGEEDELIRYVGEVKVSLEEADDAIGRKHFADMQAALGRATVELEHVVMPMLPQYVQRSNAHGPLVAALTAARGQSAGRMKVIETLVTLCEAQAAMLNLIGDNANGKPPVRDEDVDAFNAHLDAAIAVGDVIEKSLDLSALASAQGGDAPGGPEESDCGTGTAGDSPSQAVRPDDTQSLRRLVAALLPLADESAVAQSPTLTMEAACYGDIRRAAEAFIDGDSSRLAEAMEVWDECGPGASDA